MKAWAWLGIACLYFAAVHVQPVSAADAAYRLSERTYKQLSRVHELMGRERYEDALAGLDRLHLRVKHRAHEHALVLQTYGYVFANTQQYQQAVDALVRCLALDALPETATRDTLYLLAQLQMASADYRAAVTTLERWFALQQAPGADAHALAGTAYAQLKRYAAAERHLRAALTLGGNAQEHWYRQLLAVYYDSRQYPAAARLLEQMIGHYPDHRDYWLQLASVYRELGNDTRAVAVLELAYLQGVLVQEPDLVMLARFFLYAELPHKAGRLLEDSLRQGALDPAVPEHWRLLTDAWIQAKEIDLALAATERALASLQDPGLQLQRAQLLADREQWADVVRSTRLVLMADGAGSSGKAHLLQGIARFNLQQPAAAQASFRRAQGFEDTRNQAEQWIRYLSTHRRRFAQESAAADLSH